jgi:hypothetical protein
MEGVIKLAEEPKRRLYLAAEDPRDSHNLFTLVLFSVVLFALVAFKNFFTNPTVKYWWSVISLVVYVAGACIFLLRVMKSERKQSQKIIDLVICAVAVFIMTDIVFEYTFFDSIRKWFGHPMVIVVYGFFFMYYYRVYPDIQAGMDASKKQAEERQQFLKDEMKKHKTKKKDK